MKKTIGHKAYIATLWLALAIWVAVALTYRHGEARAKEQLCRLIAERDKEQTDWKIESVTAEWVDDEELPVSPFSRGDAVWYSNGLPNAVTIACYVTGDCYGRDSFYVKSLGPGARVWQADRTELQRRVPTTTQPVEPAVATQSIDGEWTIQMGRPVQPRQEYPEHWDKPSGYCSCCGKNVDNALGADIPSIAVGSWCRCCGQ